MDFFSINHKNILSPITKLPSKIIEEIDTEYVIELYLNNLRIDISKYFKGIDKLYICECNQTKYRFYFPDFITGDTFFYESLQKFNWYYPRWKWENEKALKFINIQDYVLDVGCGEGNFLKELYRRGIKNVCGIDLSIDPLNSMKNNDIPIYNETIETFSKKNENKFNVVVCFQILEHISDVNSFIKNCLMCLKPGGILFIAVPNNNPFIYRYDKYHTLNLPPHHIGLWNKSSLAALGRYYGLNIVMNEVQSIGKNISEYTLIQVQHLSANSKILQWIFNFTLAKNIYSKILYLRKNKIEGRNCVVAYRKTNN